MTTRLSLRLAGAALGCTLLISGCQGGRITPTAVEAPARAQEQEPEWHCPPDPAAVIAAGAPVIAKAACRSEARS